MEEEKGFNFSIRRHLIQVIFEVNLTSNAKLENYAEGVQELISNSVLVYLRHIIERMVDHKRKCTIISPCLTGEGDDPTGNYIETEVLYGKMPFTAVDMFECLQPLSCVYPRRNVYQLALLRVLSKRRECNKPKKKNELLELLKVDAPEGDKVEEEEKKRKKKKKRKEKKKKKE